MLKKSKKVTTKSKGGINLLLLQSRILTFLKYTTLLLLIISTIWVGLGNHVMFTNTHIVESYSKDFVVPTFYSLKDMTAKVGDKVYQIKEVVYVFRSAGGVFDTSKKAMIVGYSLSMYYPHFLVALSGIGVSLVQYKKFREEYITFAMYRKKDFKNFLIFWVTVFLSVTLLGKVLLPMVF